MSQGNSTNYNHLLTQNELDELQFQHKYNVLQYSSNKVNTSAAQSYANNINNQTGRTIATQSHSYTNPNTLNLQRWGYTATNNGGQLVCGNNSNNYEEDIQTNADNITQNTIDITQNTTDITQNTTDITQNTTDITQNTTDITQNTTDITQNTNTINTLAPKNSPELTGTVKINNNGSQLVFPDNSIQTTAYTGITKSSITTVYTVSGTLVLDGTEKYIEIMLIGGGGGGAGGASGWGTGTGSGDNGLMGGGGGAVFWKYISNGAISNLNYSVGIGGLGGIGGEGIDGMPSQAGSQGSMGGTSTFKVGNYVISATGGYGGTSSTGGDGGVFRDGFYGVNGNSGNNGGNNISSNVYGIGGAGGVGGAGGTTGATSTPNNGEHGTHGNNGCVVVTVFY
jgi:hypothetical protein